MKDCVILLDQGAGWQGNLGCLVFEGNGQVTERPCSLDELCTIIGGASEFKGTPIYKIESVKSACKWVKAKRTIGHNWSKKAGNWESFDGQSKTRDTYDAGYGLFRTSYISLTDTIGQTIRINLRERQQGYGSLDIVGIGCENEYAHGRVAHPLVLEDAYVVTLFNGVDLWHFSKDYTKVSITRRIGGDSRVVSYAEFAEYFKQLLSQTKPELILQNISDLISKIQDGKLKSWFNRLVVTYMPQ